jgi:ferrochelatase
MSSSAILLVNLGSPEQPETKYLKPYLTEFLMDERVIDIPLWWRTILVKGIIVPFRASKSAAKYKTIWTSEGSPLVEHTKKQCELLQKRIQQPVYYAMRYGKPATATVLKKMHADNPDLKKIILLPLYPHYAMSSYETAVEQVRQIHQTAKYESGLSVVPPFYNDEDYTNALTASIQPYLEKSYDHVLFSYHGIPERHVKKTDCTGNHCLQSADCCSVASPAHAFCYRHQVIETTKIVAGKLGLENGKFSYSFQSRLGRDKWLQPFTVNQLKAFPAAGIKKLLILCPAFVSDCLETLEEIQVEGREDFLKSGGEELTMVPALNENELWINCIEKLVGQQVIA